LLAPVVVVVVGGPIVLIVTAIRGERLSGFADSPLGPLATPLAMLAALSLSAVAGFLLARGGPVRWWPYLLGSMAMLAYPASDEWVRRGDVSWPSGSRGTLVWIAVWGVLRYLRGRTDRYRPPGAAAEADVAPVAPVAPAPPASPSRTEICHQPGGASPVQH
jgi:hypothetical protein